VVSELSSTIDTTKVDGADRSGESGSDASLGEVPEAQLPTETAMATPSGARDPRLPVTGARSTTTIVLGAMLLVAGIAFVVIGARRREDEPPSRVRGLLTDGAARGPVGSAPWT
jgi:LPXTG-motif cell wall-anchored protein